MKQFVSILGVLLCLCIPLVAGDDVGDASIVILLKERDVTLKRNGLQTVRLRKVFRIQKRDALERGGDISIDYNAYYKKAKLIRAVTKAPDGREFRVRKDDVYDTMPRHFESYRMYSDVRTLSFSMPALQVGSIVDYEVEITDRRAIMPGHGWDVNQFESFFPVEVSRYRLTYPKGMDLKISSRNMKVKPAHESHFRSQSLTWELKSLVPLEVEENMPPLHDVRRAVEVSSVPSWDAVGEWYRELLREKSALSEDVQKEAARLVKDAKTDEEKIRAIYRYLQKDIRYVGVELGRSAYTPHLALECFKNRYGDCKDQSVLLVAMLGHVGIEASLALVRPNFFGALAMDVPNPGQFNHAIVHVPGIGNGLWLDPTTRYFDEQSYVSALDGVDALVMGKDASSFIRIPPLEPSRNVERTIHEVKLHHDGRCHVRETMELVGRAAADERVSFEALDRKAWEAEVREYVESKAGRARMIAFGTSDPHDLSQPFRTWVDYETDRFLVPARAGFSLALTAGSIQWPLLLGAPRADEDDRERVYDWEQRSGRQLEVVCRIEAPRGFTLAGDAQSFHETLLHGDVTLSVKSEQDVVEARAVVVARPCRIEAGKIEAVRNGTERVLSRAAVSVVLEDRVLKLLEDQRPAEARRLVKTWASEAPADAGLQHRLGLTLYRCGRFAAAGKALERALELDASLGSAALALAGLYSGYRGTFGEGFDRDAALAVLNRAVKHAAEPGMLQLVIASLYERNDRGVRYGDGAPLAEAVKYYRKLLREEPNDVKVLAALGQCLLEQGNFKESEAAYLKAFEQEPDNLAAAAGRWEAAAFLGRTGEAMDAIHKYYRRNERRAAELQRMSGRLLGQRKYEAAAVMSEAAEALRSKRIRGKEYPALLRRLAKHKMPDYPGELDLSEPRKVMVAYMAACYYRDKERLLRCHSRRLELTDLEVELTFRIQSPESAATSRMRDYLLDLLAWEWDLTERELPGGDREIQLSPPKAASRDPGQGEVITCQVTREDGAWRICGLELGAPLGYAAMMAASYLDEDDFENAGRYVNRLLASRSAHRSEDGPGGMSLVRQMESEGFPDERTRILALTAASLSRPSDRQRALGYLERVLAVMPESRLIRRTLGLARMEQEDYEGAAALFGALVKERPSDRESIRQLANALMQLHRYDEALVQVDRLLELSPADLMVRSLQADVYEKAGRYDDAFRAFELCKAGLPPAFAVPQEAVLSALKGDDDSVRRLARKALESEPSEWVHRALYSAYLLVNDIDAAGEQSECILLKNSGSVEGLLMLARIAAGQGDVEEARHLAKRVQQVSLRVGESTFRLAGLLHTLGEYEAALATYDAIRPGEKPSLMVYAHLCKAVCHLVMGREERFKVETAAAAKVQPTDLWPAPVIRYYAGDMDFDALLAEAQKETVAIRHGQYVCEAYYYGAMRALADGKRAQAQAMLEEAVKTRSLLTTEYGLAKAHLERIRKTQ